MDRISLGISIQFARIDFCLLNLENMRIVQDLSMSYKPGSISSMLDSIDEMFFSLSRNRFLSQVVMLKVVSPIDWFVRLKSDFLSRMFKFNAYSESIGLFFKDILNSDQIEVIALDGPITFETLKSNNEEILQPLSAFFSTILSGKNAPVDDELEQALSTLKSNGSCGEMIGFLPSTQVFSYASSYFVEKFKLPREAQMLPAGDRFSLCAFSSRYPVYCEFDYMLEGGVLVNQADSSELNSFSINRKQSMKKSLGIDAKDYQNVFSTLVSKGNIVKVCDKYEDFSQIEFSKDLSLQHFDEVDLFVSQVVVIENDLRRDSAVHLMGVGQNTKYFAQLLANILNEQVGFHEYSRVSGALGAALYAGRRFLEANLVEMQNMFFHNYPFYFVYPNQEQGLVYSELLKIRG